MNAGRSIGRLAVAAVLFLAATMGARASDPENTIYLDLKYGRVVIELIPKYAPNHVERIKRLTREGFYNGLKFHRVLSGFMAQAGDPTGTGDGGSEYPDLRNEFSAVPFERGAVGMARTPQPHSANSQFFVVYGRAPWLNGQYTYLGRVVSGMEAAEKLKSGTRANNGVVADPDIIVKMQVAADADQEKDTK